MTFSPDSIRLITDGDLDAIVELVGIIQADVPSYTRAMARCAEASDWLGVARAAHAIRGAVGNIAADEVGALAGHVNAAARQPDEAAVLEAVPHLEAAVARMVDQLEDWLLGVTHAAGGR